MFGYVIPPMEVLSEEDKKLFQSNYCGLCHRLGRRYGLASRFVLNYDVTFLAITLARGNEECLTRNCIAHPFKKRECLCASKALDLSSDITIILTYWQAKDGLKDSKGLKKLKYFFATLFLHGPYRKAKKQLPDFDENTRKNLAILSDLEKENCPSLDKAADTFADLLADCAKYAQGPNPNKARILHEIFYHLSRWIYILDAVDDFEKDFQEGNYNPIAARYQIQQNTISEEHRISLTSTLQGSVQFIASAFELYDFGIYESLLHQIIYVGLPSVQNAVFTGTFHQKERK